MTIDQLQFMNGISAILSIGLALLSSSLIVKIHRINVHLEYLRAGIRVTNAVLAEVINNTMTVREGLELVERAQAKFNADE